MGNAKDRAICIGDEQNTFFSRLLTKEEKGSMGHSSRVYYCTHPGSVPFQWEEEPGKPKMTTTMEEEEKEKKEVEVPSLSLPPQFLRSPGDNIHRSSSSSASIVPKGRCDLPNFGKGCLKECVLHKLYKNGIAPLFRFMRVQSLAASQTPEQHERSHECSFRRFKSNYNEITSKAKADRCMLIESTPMGCTPFNINKVHRSIPRPSSRSRHNKLRSLIQ